MEVVWAAEPGPPPPKGSTVWGFPLLCHPDEPFCWVPSGWAGGEGAALLAVVVWGWEEEEHGGLRRC